MRDVPTPARPSIRFGVFELDEQAGELRKAGVLVGLQDQSLKVLVELLQRPGQLVTREQLRQRLWADGTFVDFDHGLNAVINRLREALGDSADSPRFIQTVPRRGYRFIAPVERGVEGREVGGQIAGESGYVHPESGEPASAVHRRTIRHHRGVMWSAVALALAISGALAYYLYPFPPTPSGPMRTIPLTTLPGKERHPSFSPEGDRIAFVWDGEKGDNDDIYVKVIGTEVPFRLTTSPAREEYPVWSPDGRQIAFVRASVQGSDVVVIPALGGAERTIFSRSSSLDDSTGIPLSWSPDGQLLAITGDDKEPCRIFLFSLETLQKQKLTDSGGCDYAPAFSPDGASIAFNRSSTVDGGIHVVAVAGGAPRRVTLEPAVWHEGLAWLPSGRELVFASTSAGRGADSSGSLWRVSAAGGTPQRLGVGGDNAANPAVARRGNRLAYEERRWNANIWKIVLPDASRPAPGPSQLIASSRFDGGQDISPDGTRIAFLSDRSGTTEIWLCDTAGANLVRLTTFGGFVGTPRWSFVGTPRWSPDSRQLAFEGTRGPSGIHVVSVEGGLPRQVVTDPGFAALASWSSDGRWIYFASSRTGPFEIWKVRAEGGLPVQVTKRGGWRASESADGKFVYYAKSWNIGGVWKVPVNGGEETRVLDLPPHLWGYWAVVKDGIYFVDTAVGSRPALRFFSFGTGRVSDVMTLDEKPIAHETGMAVSPDGKWLLYEQADYRSIDLVLVENFH